MKHPLKKPIDYILLILFLLASIIVGDFLFSGTFPFTYIEGGFILHEDGNRTLHFLLPILYLFFALSIIGLYCIVLRFDKQKKVNIGLTLLAFFIYIYASFVIPFNLTSIDTYITVGDYLRDTHGISIYGRDWSSWIMSMGPLDILLMALILRLIWYLVNFIKSYASTHSRI